MSAVNKLLKKRQQQTASEQHQQTDISSNMQNQPLSPNKQHYQKPHQPSFNSYSSNIYEFDHKMQLEYERYANSFVPNIECVKFSQGIFPNSLSTYNKLKIPLYCFTNPINPDIEMIMEKTADHIPRCKFCRAYMNCYNIIKKSRHGTKSYACFLCGNENAFQNDYDPAQKQNQKLQLTDPCYRLLGAENVYTTAPPEKVITFLIDISQSSYHSKMLYYTATVIKQVLSREEHDQTVIFFYTYDESIHEYDFSGQEVKCSILDSSIVEPNVRIGQTVGDIREKLFLMLDCLEEISERNGKQGSNFFGAFNYVFECVKHTAGRIYIFQSNQAYAGEGFCQEIIKDQNTQQNVYKPMIKSLLESANGIFFNKYVSNLLVSNISMSMFIFSKVFKNIRVLADCFKLTNSDIKLYYKDTPEELNKFYYDLHYLLGTSYYTDVRMELVKCQGWNFMAMYGNVHRWKQFITFKFCHLDQSKKVCMALLPSESQQNPPYFSFQIISNFYYERQHYLEVNTLVIPVSSDVRKIYGSLDSVVVSAGMVRTCLSGIRMQDLTLAKNKVVKITASMWNSAMAFFKKNPPAEIRSIVQMILGLLKSPHTQLNLINTTPILDRVICQRNLLQSSGYLEISTFFSPYCFRLSSMTEEMCRDDIQFVYPEVVEMKFAEVRDGMFMMDCGVVLYLFISKHCDGKILKELFGRDKFGKNQILNQEALKTDTFFSSQVETLIRVLREQKSYGWSPLYVVRCGEGSVAEKMLYLNFYMEKYQEYKTFKLTPHEFIGMLEQQFG